MRKSRTSLAARASAPESAPATASADTTPADARVERARLPTAVLSALLFVSGACALLYQVTWLRELRLVFGASTPATAAVLAIFMGGLGVGSAWFGPRADRDPRPLRLYGKLEIGIAILAVATPVLFWLVRQAYFAIGGSSTLGPYAGTLVRILLAALVLGPPSVLMGGTLPAAARVVVTDRDPNRSRLGLLYGANALGAVSGVLLATFVLLELFGARATIGLAAAANIVVGFVAFLLGGSTRANVAKLRLAAPEPLEPTQPNAAARAKPVFVMVAAGWVGAAFFLMEIVWPRMLNPLLGGSTYSFGIVLAVALLGIAAGGALYGARSGLRPTSSLLAMTCALEALFLAVPFALGDRLAVLAALLRPLGQFEFMGHVAAWSLLTMIVVFPAAVVAGFQFPLLLGLLGEGRAAIGRHTGSAYAWNTGGAILGSLAGGFGLLPALTAPGLWRMVTVLLAVLAACTLAMPARRGRLGPAAVLALLLATAAVLLVALPAGPTAAWRHSGIGAGRTDLKAFETRNQVVNWLHSLRQMTPWEAEGRESSIAVTTRMGISLIVGGKSDGNAVWDAGTQVMLGMLGAFLHPHPRNALVIGLGTGSSAGWLGSVPSIERVDVVELEPAVTRVTRMCSPVNQDALNNPRVNVRFGDGREVLLTSKRRYDLIVSEPSNPFRAGVASLLTSEFYRAAASRLTDDGLFLQWVQVYEIDFRTLHTVYATLCREFPSVETWMTQSGDFVLVGSRKPIVRDAVELRARALEEPFKSAIANTWRVTSLEGVLAHYVGNAEFSRFLAAAGPKLPNTDDRTLLEYYFARQAGGTDRPIIEPLLQLALQRSEYLPAWRGGAITPDELVLRRASARLLEGLTTDLPAREHPYHARVAAMNAYIGDDYAAALQWWQASGTFAPCDLTELAMVADVVASAGEPAARHHLEELRNWRPAEAGIVLARLHLRQGDLPAAAAALEGAFEVYRRDPWTWHVLGRRSLTLAIRIAGRDRALGTRLFAALEAPFSVSCLELHRLGTRVEIARLIEGDAPGELTRQAIDAFGKHVPWTLPMLSLRARSYQRLGDSRAGQAQRELREFVSLLPPQPPGFDGPQP